MNLPAALYAIRWLIRDTFRQAIASGMFWLMLTVSALCILICLSVSVSGGAPLHNREEPGDFLPQTTSEQERQKAARDGVDVVHGELTLAFGTIRIAMGRDAEDAIRFLQLLLAGAVADSAGILLALVWTAGFLPTFLEPGSASVLLAKPVPRWSLLVGKYLGVLAFVGFQATVFVGGTWLALGMRTGIWDAAYLLCVPMLLIHFAVFFSFSTLVAVCTRSTIACIFGSVLFWMMCWGMNYGRHALVALPQMEGASFALSGMVEAAYWALPKPADMGIILFDLLHADGHFGKMMEFQLMQSRGAFHPALSLLSSVVFTVVTFFIAGRQFVATDY